MPVAPGPNYDTITELLGAHHRDLDRLFGDVSRLSAAGDFAKAADLFADFDRGLRRHIHVEEDMLFPAFERFTRMTSGPTQVMRMEHARIQELLEEIGQLLAQNEAIERPAGELLEVLGAHNDKEESILYPMSDRNFPPSELGPLLTQMDSFIKGA